MNVLSLKNGQSHTDPNEQSMVVITGHCVVTGKLYSVTTDYRGVKSWLDGMLIQKALPGMPIPDREFLISGTSPEGWIEMFGEEE